MVNGIRFEEYCSRKFLVTGWVVETVNDVLGELKDVILAASFGSKAGLFRRVDFLGFEEVGNLCVDDLFDEFSKAK